jgi:restriction system protein
MLLLFVLVIILGAVLTRPEVRGWMGEETTTFGMWLSLDAGTYHRIDNLIVPSRGDTTQIDHLLVSIYGIFVIETKNMKGWIFGSAKDARWTQVLFGRKYPFQNPLKQNYRHTRSLAEYLHLDHRVFHSVVWFIGDCTFKTAMPENVLDSGLSAYIELFSQRWLTDGQVAEIAAALRALKENPVATRSEHIRSLHARHASGTQGGKVRAGTADLYVAASPDLGVASKTCPDCAAEIESEARVCQSCGRQFKPPPPPDTTETGGDPPAQRFGARWEDLTAAWQAAIIRDACPRCQSSPALEIQGADVRCKRCGAVFPRPTQSGGITLACPTCGVPVTPAQPICPKCGLRVRLSRPA